MIRLCLTSWEVRITNSFCFGIIIAQKRSNGKKLQIAIVAGHRILGSFLDQMLFF